MFKRLSVAAISMCIAACAASGPEAPAPTATPSSTSVDAVASEDPSAPAANEPNEQDAAGAPESESATLATKSEIVCRKQRVSGSRMVTTFCRPRAEIEDRAEKDKETLRQMRSTMSGAECALNNSC